MKKRSFIRVKFFFMVMVMVAFFIPIHLSAQEAKYPWEKHKNDKDKGTDITYYMAVKPGIYSPQKSGFKSFDIGSGIYSLQTSDIKSFDTGFNGEIAFGCRPNPNFAAEMGVGYFHTGVKGPLLPYDVKVKADINVMPITFTFNGILPYKQWEFFALGGIGGYWVFGDLKASGTVDGLSGTVNLNDSTMIFGGHLGLGFHYNITPTVFVGAEGKYLWTSKAKLQDEVYGVPVEAKFKMDGILATAVIGFRF